MRLFRILVEIPDLRDFVQYLRGQEQQQIDDTAARLRKASAEMKASLQRAQGE